MPPPTIAILKGFSDMADMQCLQNQAKIEGDQDVGLMIGRSERRKRTLEKIVYIARDVTMQHDALMNEPALEIVSKRNIHAKQEGD